MEKSGGGSAKKSSIHKVIPLCGPSCKLRLARFSAWLKFQYMAECGNIALLLTSQKEENDIKPISCETLYQYVYLDTISFCAT